MNSNEQSYFPIFAKKEEENILLCNEEGRNCSFPHQDKADIMEEEASSSFIRGENNQTNRKKSNHVLVQDPRDYSRDERIPSCVSQSPFSFHHVDFNAPLMNSSSTIDSTLVVPRAETFPHTSTQCYKERSNTVTFMDQDMENSYTSVHSMDSFKSWNTFIEPMNSEFNVDSPTRMRADSMHSLTSFIYNDDDDDDDYLDELLINDWWDETPNFKAYDSTSVLCEERKKSRCSSVDEISNFFASCGTESIQEPITRDRREYDLEYEQQCQDLMKCMRRTQKSRSKVVAVKEKLFKHDSLRAKYSFRRELAYIGLDTANTDASRNKLLRLHRYEYKR